VSGGSGYTGAPTVILTGGGGPLTAGNGYTYNIINQGETSAPYGMAIDSSNSLYEGTTCCGTAATTFPYYRDAIKWTPGVVGTNPLSIPVNALSPSSFGGNNGLRSTAVDGASNVWFGEEFANSSGATTTTGSYSVVELTTSGSGTSATFTAVSPSGSIVPTTSNCSTSLGCATGGGYFAGSTDFVFPYDLEVDPSGNLWVMDQGTVYNTVNGVSLSELIGAAVPVTTPFSIGVQNHALATKP
jgi:hypothetical protein